MAPETQPVVRVVPGLVVVCAGAAAALVLHRWAGALNVLTAAVIIGVVARAVRPVPGWAQAGLTFARRRMLQAGVALLGLELSFGQVRELGLATLALVLVTVVATFVGTRWLARAAGLPAPMALFIATGFSICGVSAVAAMSGTRRHDERDVATAVALVTLCGSLAIVVLPLLRQPFGLSQHEFGLWVGASVHDVGQVVATAGGVGSTALATAMVVKLVRVLLLAPLVAAASVAGRRTEGTGDGAGRTGVPLFVVAFLALVLLRSTGIVPPPALELVAMLKTTLLAAALFALGAAVDVRTLLTTGQRALGVGLASWLLVAGVALAGVLLLR